MTARKTPLRPSEKMKADQEALRRKILELCREQFLSLSEFVSALRMNKNTIRAGYIYPLVKSGQLIQKLPAGTKATQKYKAKSRR